MATNNINQAQFSAQLEIVQTAVVYLRFTTAPPSPANLTIHFNLHIQSRGYVGPRIFFRGDGSEVLVLGKQRVPTAKELAVSDAVLFSVFDTADLMWKAEGEHIEEDEEESEGEDEARDWVM